MTWGGVETSKGDFWWINMLVWSRERVAVCWLGEKEATVGAAVVAASLEREEEASLPLPASLIRKVRSEPNRSVDVRHRAVSFLTFIARRRMFGV